MPRGSNRTIPMIKAMESGARPETFDEAYKICKLSCGQYDCEAKPLWNIVHHYSPATIHEIGRQVGGTAFLMACASRNLKRFVSVDIRTYDMADAALKKWFAYHHIDAELVVSDSRNWTPKEEVDFVYIDGEHTGEAVAAEIAAYKDVATLIGFHDYADKGWNKHRWCFKDVVKVISEARDAYGWTLAGPRVRSEVVFLTKKGLARWGPPPQSLPATP